MSTPFVCKVCGGDIVLGRHGSGWRHVSATHFDHRVQKTARESDYPPREADERDPEEMKTDEGPD